MFRTIGQLYYELENSNQAVKTFNQAQKVERKNSVRSGEAWTIYEIGKTYITFLSVDVNRKIIGNRDIKKSAVRDGF